MLAFSLHFRYEYDRYETTPTRELIYPRVHETSLNSYYSDLFRDDHRLPDPIYYNYPYGGAYSSPYYNYIAPRSVFWWVFINFWSQINFIEPIIITTISHIIGKCLHPTTTTRWLRTFTPRDAATDSRWKAIILLTLLMRLIRTSTRRWERGSFSNSREGSLKRHEFCSRF